MRLNGVHVEETFAELFPMKYCRMLVTAATERLATTSAREATGFGTSIIMAPGEAGIERTMSGDETLDGRPGAVIQVWHRDDESLQNALLGRIGQCVLTAPTTSLFDAGGDPGFRLGEQVAFFGDGHQRNEEMYGRDVWLVPRMDGDFVVEDSVSIEEGVAGGNFFVLGRTQGSALQGAEAAIDAIGGVEGVVTSFPGGICSSGSKPGSEQYGFMLATTNEFYAPSIRDEVDTALPDDVGAVYEIVMNGVTLEALKGATAAGIRAATTVEGVVGIDAGNYGGNIGPYEIHLREVL
ncbi:MAG: Formylmethanofuran--tetrahydromethanopterin formyltransferase [Methanonatronarchaeales archaeon]|nr:Formylmethanofuran--tetrahydromethanopterin formyltransferase [Methanonatronarchaeales archaeon]